MYLQIFTSVSASGGTQRKTLPSLMCALISILFKMLVLLKVKEAINFCVFL